MLSAYDDLKSLLIQYIFNMQNILNLWIQLVTLSVFKSKIKIYYF